MSTSDDVEWQIVQTTKELWLLRCVTNHAIKTVDDLRWIPEGLDFKPEPDEVEDV